MTGSLAGCVVWVTRVQGEELCRLVRAQGGVAEACPVLEIAAAPQPVQHLEEVAAADISVFVSRNAVTWGMPLVPAARLADLQARPCYCPGGQTAALLAELGFQEVYAALDSGGSEALLGLPGLAARRVAGRSIIIFRGVGGRELLRRELQERGARVTHIEVYTRVRRKPGAGVFSTLHAKRRPDCVEVSSHEGLQSLCALLLQELGAVPTDLRVVVPAPRLLRTCADLGLQHPVLAEDATPQGLLAGFRRACEPSGASL